MAPHLPHRLLQTLRSFIDRASKKLESMKTTTAATHPQKVLQGQEDRSLRDHFKGIQPRSLPLQVQIRRRCCPSSLRSLRLAQLTFRRQADCLAFVHAAEDCV
ncbi:hypothetical protein QQ045_031672 [Rhodiola kirilowii]